MGQTTFIREFVSNTNNAGNNMMPAKPALKVLHRFEFANINCA